MNNYLESGTSDRIMEAIGIVEALGEVGKDAEERNQLAQPHALDRPRRS